MNRFETAKIQRGILIKLKNNLINYYDNIYDRDIKYNAVEVGHIITIKGQGKDLHPSITFLFDVLKTLKYNDYEYYRELYFKSIFEITDERNNQIKSGIRNSDLVMFESIKFGDMLLNIVLELIFYKGNKDDIINDRFISDNSIKTNNEVIEYFTNVINNFNILIKKGVLPSDKNLSLVLSNPKNLDLNNLQILIKKIIKEELEIY